MIRRRRSDRGAVTAEFAVALPALLLMVGFALGAVDATMEKLRCIDAARDAALVASRGGDGEAAGQARAPDGATVTVTRSGDTVHATVTVVTAPFGAHLPGVRVTGDAVAEVEPGVAQ